MTDLLQPARPAAPVLQSLPDLGALRVLVVGADPEVRAGLLGVFEEGQGLTVAGQAGPFGLEAAPRPDVLLWHLEDAEAAERLDTAHRVVALVPDAEAAQAARAQGVQGLLPHGAAPEQIAAALVAVGRGLDVSHPDLDGPAADAPALTPREHEVLELVAEGLPNKLIADRLFVSESTVKFHIGSLLRKLDVYSRTEAVVRAVQWGLISV